MTNLSKFLDELEKAREQAGKPQYSGEGFEYETLALNRMATLTAMVREAVGALEYYRGQAVVTRAGDTLARLEKMAGGEK